MLISIAMDPTCLAPEILSCPEARIGAETLLQGVTENGVLLASDSNQHISLLASAASDLGTQTGQQVQPFIVEIGKNPGRFVAAERSHHSGSARPMDLSQLRRLALELCADIVVCRDVSDVGCLSDLRCRGIEVCTLSNYRSSRTEAKRRKWSRTTQLDQLPDAESAKLVGLTLRYATEIVVVDRFVAREAANAVNAGRISGQLRLFVQGLIYVANCWKEHSPYARFCGPTIHLISIAGGPPSAHGYVNPKSAKKIIRKAVLQLDSNRSIGRLDIYLKADKHPKIAKDRFVSGMGRCFGVQHGIDDIGKLTLPKPRRGPTSLIPDCQYYRDLLTAIKALPPAQ